MLVFSGYDVGDCELVAVWFFFAIDRIIILIPDVSFDRSFGCKRLFAIWRRMISAFSRRHRASISRACSVRWVQCHIQRLALSFKLRSSERCMGFFHRSMEALLRHMLSWHLFLRLVRNITDTAVPRYRYSCHFIFKSTQAGRKMELSWMGPACHEGNCTVSSLRGMALASDELSMCASASIWALVWSLIDRRIARVSACVSHFWWQSCTLVGIVRDWESPVLKLKSIQAVDAAGLFLWQSLELVDQTTVFRDGCEISFPRVLSNRVWFRGINCQDRCSHVT